jgi:hypothetical protein
MAQSSSDKLPAPKPSKKDFYLLKIHGLFDEIETILDAKAYRTEGIIKATQLLKTARFFVLKAFEASCAD